MPGPVVSESSGLATSRVDATATTPTIHSHVNQRAAASARTVVTPVGNTCDGSLVAGGATGVVMSSFGVRLVDVGDGHDAGLHHVLGEACPTILCKTIARPVQTGHPGLGVLRAEAVELAVELGDGPVE